MSDERTNEQAERRLQLEKQVLGYALLCPDEAIRRICELGACWETLPHRYIWEAIFNRWRLDREVSVVKLAQDLNGDNVLDYVGGCSYIVSLTEVVPRDMVPVLTAWRSLPTDSRFV